jgi:formylmethanofuran dehydrogenase subunit A
MFASPRYVFKDGVEVARDGTLGAVPMGVTHLVRPEFDAAIEERIRTFFADHMSVQFDHFRLAEGELADAGIGVQLHGCKPRRRA